MRRTVIVAAVVLLVSGLSIERAARGGNRACLLPCVGSALADAGTFSLVVTAGGQEVMNLSGQNPKALDDGTVLRIYLDDAKTQSSIVIETGETTSGEYKIGGATSSRDYASFMLMPGHGAEIAWPLHLRSGTVKTTVNGSSGSGSVEGSGESNGKTYLVKGMISNFTVETGKIDY